MLMVIQLDRDICAGGGGADCLCSHHFSTYNTHIGTSSQYVQVSAVFAKQKHP